MILQFKTILDRVPRSVGVIALDIGSGYREFESSLRDFFFSFIFLFVCIECGKTVPADRSYVDCTLVSGA